MSDEILKLKQLDEHSFQIDMRGAAESLLKSPNAHSVNNNNSYAMVIDCDEVLVNIVDKWLTNASHVEELGQYFTEKVLLDMCADGKLEKFSTIWRPDYYFQEWLGITDPAHIKLINDVYFCDPNFYDDLLPTPFFRSLSAILDVVSSIDILTMCGADVNSPTNVSKGKWLHKYFTDLLTNRPDIKFKTHFIPSDRPKGVYLKEQGIKFNVYVEDCVANVVNVVETMEFDNFEVLVRLYGSHRHIGQAVKDSTSELKFRITGFHNTDDYTQQQVLDAFTLEEPSTT